MASEPLYRLVYASSATQPFSTSQLTALLEHARAANHERGITGMLLYKDGSFIQLIEGVEHQLRALYAKIALDPRHHRLDLVFEGPAENRLFYEWSMGFRDLADPALLTLPGFSDYMNNIGTAASARLDPQGCLGLLGMFRSTL